MRLEFGLIMGVVSHPVANKNLNGSAPTFYERRLEMSDIYEIHDVCSVYVNVSNSITIQSEKDGDVIIIDECCAEKLCSLIMKCAKLIRSENDE